MVGKWGKFKASYGITMTATRRQVGVRQKQTIGCLTLGFCKIEHRHRRVLLGSIFIVVDGHWQPCWKASFAGSFHSLPCYVERRSSSLKHKIPRRHDSRLFRVVVATVGSHGYTYFSSTKHEQVGIRQFG